MSASRWIGLQGNVAFGGRVFHHRGPRLASRQKTDHGVLEYRMPSPFWPEVSAAPYTAAAMKKPTYAILGAGFACLGLAVSDHHMFI